MKKATLEQRIGKLVIDKLRLPRRNKAGEPMIYKRPSKYHKPGDMVDRRIKNVSEFKKYYLPYLNDIFHNEMNKIGKIKSNENLKHSNDNSDYQVGPGQTNLNHQSRNNYGIMPDDY